MKIVKVPQMVIDEGKFVQVDKYAIADDENQPVSDKTFDSKADAKELMTGLVNFEKGLAFGKAQYPGMSAKSLKGKANLIASYLGWEEDGRPVKKVDPKKDVNKAGDDNGGDNGEEFE